MWTILVAACLGAEVPDSVVAAGLAGDLRPVLDDLDDLDPDVAAALRARFVDRSEPLPASGKPFYDRIAPLYRTYWTDALTGEPGAEEALLDALRDTGCDEDDVLSCVKARLAEEGVHVANGRTPPLLDLLAWTEQGVATYEVMLTDGPQTVRVVEMSGVVDAGWSSYATLGEASTGGWADREQLYCFIDGYDRDSERFRISYLAHEGRHFADYERFPDLESTDLEYRAKLTELALADETLPDLVARFAAGADPAGGSPHGAANHRVVTEIEAALGPPGEARPRRLRRTARRLLEADTRSRTRGLPQ